MLGINLINNFHKNMSYPPFNSYRGKVMNTSLARYNNLAPLSHDTVSFSGAKNLNRGLMEAIDNSAACKYVFDNAKEAELTLKRTLNARLKSLVVSEKNQRAPIQYIATRTKTPESIREKSISQLEYALTDDISKVFSPKDPNAIKDALGDIVGARIVMRDSSPKQTSKVIAALIEEVKAGGLKITNIENYQPENLPFNLLYFDNEDLKKLQVAANANRLPYQKEVGLSTKTKGSGYMALHIDIELPKYGYKGEIQILGCDVENLKDIEDFCYKINQGKDIKGGDIDYKPFVDYYKKYMNSEKYPNIEESFKKYTEGAYLMQRKKEPVYYSDRKKACAQNSLPTIAQCGMQGKIPMELDFNNLAAIKKDCDRLHDTKTKIENKAAKNR